MKWDTLLGAFLGTVWAVLILRLCDALIKRWMQGRNGAYGRPIAAPQRPAKRTEPVPGKATGPVLGSTRFSQVYKEPRRTGPRKDAG